MHWPLCVPAALRHADGVLPAGNWSGYAPWALGVVAVAVAEEALLRGSLYAAIEQRAGAVAAIGATACAFAAVHVPLYGWSAVPLDLAGRRVARHAACGERVGDRAGARPRARRPRRLVAALTAARVARPAGAVVAALVLLTIGWLLAPRFAPPIYDGVGFPDEPYRFVVPPSDAKTHKAPTTATAQIPVTKGTAAAAVLNSAEQAPQVAVLIPTGRLQAPAGPDSIVLHAAPVHPVRTPSGTICGATSTPSVRTIRG